MEKLVCRGEGHENASKVEPGNGRGDSTLPGSLRRAVLVEKPQDLMGIEAPETGKEEGPRAGSGRRARHCFIG